MITDELCVVVSWISRLRVLQGFTSEFARFEVNSVTLIASLNTRSSARDTVSVGFIVLKSKLSDSVSDDDFPREF